MAQALAEAGSRVVVTSRELDRAVEIARQLPDPNDVNHLGAVLDHMDVAELDQRFQTISEQAGCIDVLVNNGHEHCPNDWTDISGEQFTRILANAMAIFFSHALFIGRPWIQDSQPVSSCSAPCMG